MVVNTESVVGYNNKLKKATTFMRIGVNSDLNIPVRRSTQKHNLGSRAVKLPHSGVETEPVRQRMRSLESWRKPSSEQRKRRWLKAKKRKKRKKRGEVCFDFAREQFECFDYCRRCFSLVSFQMK